MYILDSFSSWLTSNGVARLISHLTGCPAIYQSGSHEGKLDYYFPSRKPKKILTVNKDGGLCDNYGLNDLDDFSATAFLEDDRITLITSRNPKHVELVTNSGLAKAIQDAQASLKNNIF